METWLRPEFWQEVITGTLHWLIATAPSVLVILVLAWVTLKAIDLSLPRLRSVMTSRGREGGAASVEELKKRIETLIGVVTTLLKGLVWAMVVLLLLRKFGVDVAPLIAGLGIAGLALGFGAQELVRDVISWFFILLENQMRTGDVAVINGTGASWNR